MSKSITRITWDEVPHLSESAKAEMLESTPPYQRDARSKGIPSLGAGAIYQVPESEFVVKDFELPAHYPRVYGFDVGWNRTAAIWAAWDRETDTLYLYSEHYRGQVEPSVHADAIKARGAWIKGVIDPSANSSESDGRKLMEVYKILGLQLQPADNAVEAGLLAVWQRLSAGRIKVFASLQNWLKEYRIYRREENGKVVKSDDHLMDATRYLVMSGLDYVGLPPAPKEHRRTVEVGRRVMGGGGKSWMGT